MNPATTLFLIGNETTGGVTTLGGSTVIPPEIGTLAAVTQTANSTVSFVSVTSFEAGWKVVPVPSGAVLHPPKVNPGFSNRPVLRATVTVEPNVNVTGDGSTPAAAPLAA